MIKGRKEGRKAEWMNDKKEGRKDDRKEGRKNER